MDIQLKRGLLDVCVLAAIKNEDSYGYTVDVTGTLLSEKVFIAQSGTGRIDVPETTTDGKCKITTDTGRISLSIEYKN